jgi:hypothetical protein
LEAGLRPRDAPRCARGAGFDLKEANIESRSFQCRTRICLVNHFQGRVSCPTGQVAPQSCADAPCPEGEVCNDDGALLTDCDPSDCGEPGADPNNCNDPEHGNLACHGGVCDEAGRFCPCTDGSCPSGYTCDAETHVCTIKVCAPRDPKPGSDGRCYVPGGVDPVSVSVCSQCAERPAENAVYCSCRCGPPDDNPPDADENFNFCECPEGYTCQEIRPNIGLIDAQLTGKYCVKEGTVFSDESECNGVVGVAGGACAGLAEP